MGPDVICFLCSRGTSRAAAAVRWEELAGSRPLGALTRTLVLKKTRCESSPSRPLYMSDWGLMEGWLERNSFLAADGHSQIKNLKPGVICVPLLFVCFIGRVAAGRGWWRTIHNGVLFVKENNSPLTLALISQTCYWQVNLTLKVMRNSMFSKKKVK